ncbi:MAG: alpha/beta hydrolase [Rhodospirillaceae bacterium]
MANVDALQGPVRAPASGKTPTSAVVFAHGYGSNGDDLITLAPFFAHALPDAIFYSPNAPDPWEGGMMGGRQWYSLAGFDPEAIQRDPLRMGETFRAMNERVVKAAVRLDLFLDQILAAHSLAPERLALIGFSQGTIMSLHVGLRRTQKIGAILGFSGALSAADKLPGEIRTKPPVALVHGAEDPVIPVHATVETEKVLKGLDVPVQSMIIPGLQHGIDNAGANFGAQFLHQLVG